MKKTKEQIEWEANFKKKVPDVKINPELDKYVDNTPFPRKLAEANEILKNVKLPPRKPGK